MWKKLILYSGLFLVLSCNLHQRRSGTAVNSGKETFGGSFARTGEVAISKKKNAITTEHIYYPRKIETPRFAIGLQKHETTPAASGKIHHPKQNPSSQDAIKIASAEVKSDNCPMGSKSSSTAAYPTKTAKRTESNFLVFAGILGLAAFGLFRLFRNYALKITRWTNTHKAKTRALIAGMQVALGALGVGFGKALHEVGYDFSSHTEYLFGGITLLGLAHLILQKRESITLMHGFHLKRLGFLAVSTSMFMLFAGFGNKIGQGSNQSHFASNVVEKVDNYLYADKGEIVQFSQQDPEPKAETQKTTGKGALIALYVFLALVLVLLLAVASCALWCTFGSIAGLPAVLLSVLLLYVVLRAMAKHVKEKYS